MHLDAELTFVAAFCVAFFLAAAFSFAALWISQNAKSISKATDPHMHTHTHTLLLVLFVPSSLQAFGFFSAEWTRV